MLRGIILYILEYSIKYLYSLYSLYTESYTGTSTISKLIGAMH